MRIDPAVLPAGLTFLVLIAGFAWFMLRDLQHSRRNNRAYDARKLRLLVADVLEPLSPLQLEAIQLFAECEQLGWNLPALDAERFPQLSKRT